MENQPVQNQSMVTSGTGPVQGGEYNVPATSDKNFIFKHKRLVVAIVLLGLLLVLAIVIANTVFFKKPQSKQQEAVEAPPFDINSINKDSDLPQTGAE